MTTPLVFLSHASEDRVAAMRVCHALEESGVPCWIAPRNISPGEVYASAISEAIEKCSVFVVIFSAAASTSPHVKNEIENAASCRAPMLICRTDEADPAADSEISLFVKRHQWLVTKPGEIEADPRVLVDAVRKLVEQKRKKGATEETNPPAKQRARSSGSTDAALRAIGLDVGSTKIRCCVRDLNSPETASARDTIYLENILRPVTPKGLLGQMTELLSRVIDAERLTRRPPVGIGVAVPGQVDMRTGTLKFAPGLGVRNVPIRNAISTAFPGVPVRVDNDARCATRCELYIGSGRDFDSFVCMFIGTGIGSSAVVDRAIVYGHNFCAGEIGHTKIASSGPPCTCGQIGCLETFANGPAIVARARAKVVEWESRDLHTLLAQYGDELDSRNIVAALDAGDAAALEVVEEIGGKLGLGIANCINVVNPAAVILGGGVMTGYFLHMIDSVTRTIQRNAVAESANTPIVQSSNSDDGAAIGAALMFHPQEKWRF